MRNARGRRTISLWIATVAVLTLVVTIATHEKGTGPGAWFGVVLASFFTSLFSVVALITFHLHVRWQQKLERGDRFLAKWRVLPAEWAQFREREKARLDAGRGNNIRVRRISEETGVDVIVAQDSLMIDNDFFKLVEILGLQYLPETPPCLEYNMVTRGKNGSVRWNIRFPVATGAEAGARAIWDYVNAPKPPVDEAKRARRFRVARVIGLIVGIVSLPLFVFGFTIRSTTENQAQVLTCLVIGMMGTPLGFFISGLSHWMLRGAKSKK
ncbi:MAG: hypothetical protein ABI120_08655 [Gemmatimonadaceae bacterium]